MTFLIKNQEKINFFLFLIQPHRQADPFFDRINVQYLYIHDIPNADCFQRMLDKTVRDLGNVHQSVLMDADIHEYAKVDDVTDGSL